MTGMNAVELAWRLEPVRMFYVEDILPPEQLFYYYKNIREICTTPQAVGELFTHPLEAMPLIKDNLIDFMRNRVAATVGITPMRKYVHSAKSAVSQLAAYYIDISNNAFGIQEENHFPLSVHEMFPGMAEIRKGYLYGSGKTWARPRYR
jgi:mannonate dehydratase